MLVPRGGQTLDRRLVHPSFHFVFHRLNHPRPHLRRHRRVRLIGEVVAAQVRGLQGHRRIEIRQPVVERLTGDGEDQVEVDVPDARRPRELDAALDVGRIMPPLQRLELFGLERLGPEAEAVHPTVNQHRQQVRVDRLRIGLEGELIAALQRQVIPNRIQHGAPMLGGQERRRSPAEENRPQRPLEVRPHESQFLRKPLHEHRLAVATIHQAVEIAIMTFVETERHVTVDPLRRAGRCGQLAKNIEIRDGGRARAALDRLAESGKLGGWGHPLVALGRDGRMTLGRVGFVSDIIVVAGSAPSQ